MDTLTNVNEALRPFLSPGFVPSAIPEAKSSQTGVSVEYVPDSSRQWYVLRASYGRETLAEDMLINAHIYAYVAKRYIWTEVDGRPKKVLQKLVSNLVFAYMTPAEAEMLVMNRTSDQVSPKPHLSAFLSYYYDHFNKDEKMQNPPLTIPEHEMLNFIRATCTHNENIMILQGDDDYRYKSNDEVLVVYGPFAGVRGRVIRAHGQQRVLVKFSRLSCLCATAYVPSAFIQKV